jgi:23S rRNA (uridine2552-2'-O)-methyltransferase
LEELDRRHRLLAPGARVLDLGCRPGSWLQYARRRAGAQAPLVGVDREPLEVTIPGARIVVGDALLLPADTLRGELAAFDLVLSDMAPDTTGIRAVDQARSEALFERALELAETLLAPGGHFVGKLFQGPDLARLRARARQGFETVTLEKPAGSRKESIELYLVALRRRPPIAGISGPGDR